MPVLDQNEFEFIEITVNGKSYPSNPSAILAPESEDPFWEIRYPQKDLVVFATGVVTIEARKIAAPEKQERKEKHKERGPRENVF